MSIKGQIKIFKYYGRRISVIDDNSCGISPSDKNSLARTVHKYVDNDEVNRKMNDRSKKSFRSSSVLFISDE